MTTSGGTTRTGGGRRGPAVAAGMDLEERKRLARRLAGAGRGFAEEYGVRVTNNPSGLFRVLCLSVLLARRGDPRRAAELVGGLAGHGWDSPARLARSTHADRASALRAAGRRADADELAVVLDDLGREIVERYRGDLRRIRVESRYDPDTERRRLRELPGVDDPVVELFLREVQALWPEVPPVADRRALTAARRLGLGRSVEDLVALAGSRESERFAWLVGALARVDLENRYDDPLGRTPVGVGAGRRA